MGKKRKTRNKKKNNQTKVVEKNDLKLSAEVKVEKPVVVQSKPEAKIQKESGFWNKWKVPLTWVGGILGGLVVFNDHMNTRKFTSRVPVP